MGKLSANAPPPHGRHARSWIPYAFVGGMAVVVIVNMALVWLALSTWTGLVVDRPYERGVAYNRVLAADARERSLGWRIDIAYAADARRITVTVVDRDGQGLGGLAIDAMLIRPLESVAMTPLKLIHDGDGRYLAELVPPRRGQWDVVVQATRGGDSIRASHRFIVP